MSSRLSARPSAVESNQPQLAGLRDRDAAGSLQPSVSNRQAESALERFITTLDDPEGRHTVRELMPRGARVYPVGRLDADTSGLLLLTNDGDLAHKLMHPSNLVVKRYYVSLEEPFPAGRLRQLLRGVVIDGEHLKVEKASLVNPKADRSSPELDVHMHHGKKREIRQLFTALGFEVRRLRRYQIGAFRLKGIPLRGVKQLSTKEISSLFVVPAAHYREMTPSTSDEN